MLSGWLTGGRGPGQKALPGGPPARRRHPGAHERWLLYGFRGLLIGLMALLMLLGLRAIAQSLVYRPLRALPAPGASEPASTYPTEAASGFAVRFAQAYETYDSADVRARQQALQEYLAAGAQDTGWDGTGKQTAASAIPSGIKVLDPRRALVTVAVDAVTTAKDGKPSGRWLFLAVPVYADSDGALLVTGPPTLVPPPARPALPPPAPPGAAGGNEDPVAEQSLKQQLPDFFKAYAAPDAGQALARWAAPGVTLQGLDGQVAFGDLETVVVPQAAAGQPQTALAAVRWTDPASGAGFIMAYQLTIVPVAGEPHVSAVRPAPQ